MDIVEKEPKVYTTKPPVSQDNIVNTTVKFGMQDNHLHLIYFDHENQAWRHEAVRA